MADASDEAAKEHPELRLEPAVQKLESSLQDNDHLNVLTGLLGSGLGDEVWRLYLTREMDEYVEFDSGIVVHSRPVDESDAMAGTSVWVRANSNLRYVHITSAQVQADFLRGGITAAHLHGAQLSHLSPAGSETGYACTRNYVCSTNRHIPACQDRTDYCGPGGGGDASTLCPTGPFVKGC